MATITLKNIPDPTYKTLKQLAAEHHRSINSEVIYLIEKATKSTKIDPLITFLFAFLPYSDPLINAGSEISRTILLQMK